MAVTNLSPEICKKLKEARRAAKLSQSVVAADIGCKQSALSMFEQGDGTKLNDGVIRKLAEKFGVSLEESVPVSMVAGASTVVSASRGFCPNPNCPSNRAYEVDARTLLRPERSVADPVCGKFCAVCGEILEKRCPNCGAPVHDGAICTFCGEPYIVKI